MRHHRLVQATAAFAAASVVALSAGPALAATPVAQADATALEIGLAGNATNSGTFTATHDGSTLTTTGNNAPAITAVSGQDLIRTGTLAQNATAGVSGGAGSSAACSGLAGEGATVAAVGESNCLTPGDTLTLHAATMDLSGLRILGDPIRQQLISAGIPLDQVDGLVQQITTPLGGALAQALTALGDLGIVLDLGVVQATCRADTASATGGANLAGVKARLAGLGHSVVLADLPVNPAPHTKVVTDLDRVVIAVTDALRTQFANALTGALDPVSAALITPIQTQLVEGAVAQIADQLAPLEENVLDITLNEQTSGPGSIEVTALHAKVLPAAAQFIDTSLVDLQIGRVSCGPHGRVATTAQAAAPQPKPGPKKQQPQVPTSIPAGADSAADLGQDSPVGTLALGGLLLAATGAGVIGHRRFAGQ